MLEKSGYYEILGVPKIASPEELKKGYKRAAMKIHPDKGGNTEKFKELGLAYSVLSDPEKRRKYDEELDARKKVVDELRCNDNPFRQQPLPKRGDDYVRELEVSLEELYSGTTETIPVTRRNISKDVVLEERLFKVVVCPGMMNGQEIKFPRTGMFPGIVFVLKQKDHPRFERKNDDLFMDRKLSLYQAQNGFSGFIETLDGRKIFIKTRPGKRFSVTVNHQGMPVYGSEQPRWGDLHIRFARS